MVVCRCILFSFFLREIYHNKCLQKVCIFLFIPEKAFQFIECLMILTKSQDMTYFLLKINGPASNLCFIAVCNQALKLKHAHKLLVWLKPYSFLALIQRNVYISCRLIDWLIISRQVCSVIFCYTKCCNKDCKQSKHLLNFGSLCII